MADPLFPENEEFYSPDYKIVDLPIIDVPVLEPISTFNAKIYRFVDEEWKRICHGKIKFYKFDYVVVSAFENWSCHKRMYEIPSVDSQKYNLVPSEQFAYNWIFVNENETKMSIALAQENFQPFKELWDTTKSENSQLKEIKWLDEIEIDLFE